MVCVDLVPNTILYQKGDKADCIYIVEHGLLKDETQPSSKSISSKFYNKANIIGLYDENLDVSYLSNSNKINSRRNSTVVCIEPSTLFRISIEDYEKLRRFYCERSAIEKKDCISSTLYFSKSLLQIGRLGNSAREKICRVTSRVLFSSLQEDSELSSEAIFIVKSGTVSYKSTLNTICYLTKNKVFNDIRCFYGIKLGLEYKAKGEAICYRIYKADLQSILGSNYLNKILYSYFKCTVSKSPGFLSMIKTLSIESVFEQFKLTVYDSKSVVFQVSNRNKNRKICVIISGTLIKQSNWEIVANDGDLIEDSVREKNESLSSPVVSQGNVICLEAQWNDIITSKSSNVSKEIDPILSEKIEKIEEVKLFSILSRQKIRALADLMTLKQYKANSVILEEGLLKHKAMYIVNKGKVLIKKNGKVVKTFEKCYFGEIGLVTGESNTPLVLAMTDVEVYQLTSSSLLKVLDRNTISNLKSRISISNAHVSLDNLYFIKELGRSHNAVVFLVHNYERLYALKYMDKAKFHKAKSIENVVLEKNIMKMVDFPFIVKLGDSYQTPSEVFLLMEYINGINLKDYILKRGRDYDLYEPQFYAGTLMLAIEYLHRKSIIHRDIKPSNIVIGEDGYIKLIDFGISKVLKDFTQTVCGTPQYMAPEIVNKSQYSFPVDFWSLGVTLYELFYGELPFGNQARSNSDIYYEILNK